MEGGLLEGVLCRLKLLENRLGKGVNAEILGGVPARVECHVELHVGTIDREDEG